MSFFLRYNCIVQVINYASVFNVITLSTINTKNIVFFVHFGICFFCNHDILIKICVYNLLFVNNFVNMKLHKRYIGLAMLGRAQASCAKRKKAG